MIELNLQLNKKHLRKKKSRKKTFEFSLNWDKVYN